MRIVIRKVATGHNPPAFRCGKWQDARKRRERTRSAERKKWQKFQEI